MARRIALALIVLASAYTLFHIYVLYTGHSKLEAVAAEYTIGPADADLRVVEFLDYSCPYCREVHPTITEAVKQDGKVLYIPRPLPSSDPDSLYASKLAYAAGMQGKFAEMHSALIQNFRAVDESLLADLSLETGADAARLKSDAENPEILKYLSQNADLFHKFKTEATPTFMIGGKIIYVPTGHMPTVSDFLAMFDEARGMK